MIDKQFLRAFDTKAEAIQYLQGIEPTLSKIVVITKHITDENGKGFKLLKIFYSNLILLILRPNLFLKRIFFKLK